MADDKTAPGGSQKAGDAKTEEFSHYVHLVDGRVVKVDLSAHDAVPLGTALEEGEGDNLTRTGIIGVYPR
jgi:hypothetical protein